MAIAYSALFFIVMVVVLTWFTYRVYSKPARFHERLGAAVATEQPMILDPGPSGGRKWYVRVIERIGEKVPISPQDAGVARRYLIAAGFRSDAAIRIHYGVKITLMVAFFIAAVLLRKYATSIPFLQLVLVVGGTAAGYFLPNFIMEWLVGRRQDRLRMSLPDALDLMVVCLEAGLALDQAVSTVARELALTHKDIAEELGLVTLEMRAGKSRAEALKNLADRTAEPELKKLVATMIQSDRFGTSVTESLRTHSEFMRVRRRQAAEERAAKVGVKLVFPIFFFILPTMLIVSAGPGILALTKHLFPMMQSAGR